MRGRVALVAALAAAAAGAVAWRRRRRSAGASPVVQLGLADGSTVRLDSADPAAAELRARAHAVRAALEAVG